MTKRELIDIMLQLHAETSLALRVSETGVDKDAVWLPISQIEINERLPNGIIDVTMPEWLAKDKGLV